jgi:hypothetical protein
VSIFFLKIGVDGKYNDWTVFREATYIFFPPVGKECGYTYCIVLFLKKVIGYGLLSLASAHSVWP